MSERHRHRVLQLGAAHLQHISEFLGFALEGAAQVGHRIDQAEDADVGRQLQRRRIDVVGRLAHVHVLVRVQVLVFAALVTEQFEGAVGDHLVGVHVRRGAGAALDDVHDEFIVILAGDDLVARGGDRRRLLGIEQAQLLVGERGGLLDLGQGADQVRVNRDRDAGDVEILFRAQGMHAVVGGGRNVLVTEQVMFITVGRHVFS